MFRFLVLVLALSAAAYGDEGDFDSSEVPVKSIIPTQEEVQAAADNLERIVGGSAIDISEVPYQLSLRVSNSHVCGASLISASWAVTAAHCTTKRTASVLSLRAGSNKHKSGGETRSVSKLINHSSYNSGTYDNDISLLKLSSAFTLGSSIKVVSLPKQGSGVSTGTYGIVSGWGTLKEGGSASSTLQHVWVPVVDQSKCNTLNGGVTKNMICAGLLSGGKDACQGDSGGPFVIDGTLIGIVSWGYGCARPNLPGVYTRASMYRDWIKTNAGI